MTFVYLELSPGKKTSGQKIIDKISLSFDLTECSLIFDLNRFIDSFSP